ncbi:uncharacterized protein LOC106663434 isoform X2 [Cimex lectularius]|nr:uncharacterized protein LOC106663434 isoform X2 [Cimex lectularius]
MQSLGSSLMDSCGRISLGNIVELKRVDKPILTEAQVAIAQGEEPRKRQYLPTIHARGTFYDVGYAIGRTFRAAIADSVNRKFAFNDKTLLYSESRQGKELYNKLLANCLHHYPQYIRELRGMADGSGISFSKLFVLQVGSDIMSYSRGHADFKNITSSTTLVLNTKHQIMGQVEDQPASSLGNAFIVRASINEDNHYKEEFTAVCVAGSLPGWEMAVNYHGLAFTVNSIRIRNFNLNGIPKRIICRALLAAHSIEKAKMILYGSGFGIADAINVTCTFANDTKERIFYSIEVAPPTHDTTYSQLSIEVIKPGTTFSHYNGFKHLKQWLPNEDLDFVNWNRHKEQTIERYPMSNVNDIKNILGDTGNCRPFKNIFSVADQVFSSVVVGIFDLRARTLTIYLDNPKQAIPHAVINF